jgi:hypothetical protein
MALIHLHYHHHYKKLSVSALQLAPEYAAIPPSVIVPVLFPSKITIPDAGTTMLNQASGLGPKLAQPGAGGPAEGVIPASEYVVKEHVAPGVKGVAVQGSLPWEKDELIKTAAKIKDKNFFI